MEEIVPARAKTETILAEVAKLGLPLHLCTFVHIWQRQCMDIKGEYVLYVIAWLASNCVMIAQYHDTLCSKSLVETPIIYMVQFVMFPLNAYLDNVYYDFLRLQLKLETNTGW